MLCNRQPKARADVISYFIKVAHHLIDPLKSLYSSYAIFCALTSEPLHRLEKTWAYVSKKDKQMFDKIADLFSQNENSIKLRTFMEEAINRPGGGICIPNLSTFLRDIIHVAENYSENNANRDKNLEKLYGFIEKCQQSNYGISGTFGESLILIFFFILSHQTLSTWWRTFTILSSR